MDAVLQLADSLLTSPWLYPLILALVLVDAVLPLLPAETVVITAAAYATTGQPDALLVLLATWSGALLGDVIAHLLGRRAGPVAKWLRRRRWGGSLLSWAEEEMRVRGGTLLITARFIPGGRTASTLASGIIGYPRSRFLAVAAISTALWSLYSVGIGMLGGLAFHEQPLLGVALGIGLALAVGGISEAVRAIRARRRPGTDRPSGADGRRTAARRSRAGARAGVAGRPRISRPPGAELAVCPGPVRVE
ncbi:DedA family protein [Brachybacterium alimentarium]|uniref:DedA family protein n=1 Tax=Brachybacterium alimentarium TaxID=47845 RepID=UPI000DF26893|nr:DedA family protein [Brachybacterium alimentarium]RCS74186.1 DedA family protein [Brachybacterium alimentarium]